MRSISDNSSLISAAVNGSPARTALWQATVALIFFFFQRYLIQGLTAGSVKG